MQPTSLGPLYLSPNQMHLDTCELHVTRVEIAGTETLGFEDLRAAGHHAQVLVTM